MPSSAFLSPFAPVTPSGRATRTRVCATARPPNDPSNFRTESERRRNAPPQPMRRRRRRRSDAALDWDALPSVPLVPGGDASPESGEDYWIDLDDSRLDDPGVAKTGVRRKRKKKPIKEELQVKLKKEVVGPYKDNWILRVAIVVGVLVLLVAVFGGEDTVPIIKVPDL